MGYAARDMGRCRRLPAWLAAAGLLAVAGPAWPQAAAGPPAPPTATAQLLEDLLPYKAADAMVRALRDVERRGDRAMIPALVELLRFELPVPTELPAGVLEALAGERLGPGWRRWVEWLGTRPDIVAPPEFAAWKGRLFALIDPEFAAWFGPGVPHRIRLEEIVWGGVVKDGIPALTNPRHVAAAEASWLTDEELVFGVTINGESRAYPHRIMDWHEMANDVVGGVPVALAY
jgi:hypothetical protein